MGEEQTEDHALKRASRCSSQGTVEPISPKRCRMMYHLIHSARLDGLPPHYLAQIARILDRRFAVLWSPIFIPEFPRRNSIISIMSEPASRARINNQSPEISIEKVGRISNGSRHQFDLTAEPVHHPPVMGTRTAPRARTLVRPFLGRLHQDHGHHRDGI
jgi:hypothetical protein